MRSRLIALAFTALSTALVLPATASAQGLDEMPEDKNKVMLITFVVALAALGASSVGFLYRRMKGMLHAPPDNSSHAADHH